MAAQTPTGRWQRWALIVSVSLNFLFIGLIVGAVVLGPQGRRPGASGPRDAALPYTRALDRDSQRSLRTELRRAVAEARPKDALRSQYMTTLALLRAEPFDADALRTHFAEQTNRTKAVQSAGQDVLARHLTQMSAAERTAYADRLEVELERFFSRGPGGSRPKP